MDSIFIIFYLDMINRIVRIFFACGEGPFGRRPHYPNDPVDLPAHAFTHCQIFCDAQPYVHSCSIGRFFSHGRQVLSNCFFLRWESIPLFLYLCRSASICVPLIKNQAAQLLQNAPADFNRKSVLTGLNTLCNPIHASVGYQKVRDGFGLNISE